MIATHANGGRARSRWRALVPVALFTLLAGLFWLALWSGDPARLPSALIGKPAPAFSLPPLAGLSGGDGPVPGFATRDLRRGEPAIVNVWASWCLPCHREHPQLVALAARSGAPLYGINYKDEADAARRFLGRYGNPFTAIGVDANGRAAIDWGVYGVPETFIVDGRGRIVHKHVGPIDEAALNARLLPAIEAARGAPDR